MINQEPAGGRPRDVAADNPRRAQILDAALEVMAEHGFRGASIKRIAERAGLKSPALIYWYFRDKDALLEAVLAQLAPVLGEVAGLERQIDEPPEVVLPRLVTSFVRTVSRPPMGRFVRVLLSEVARHPAAANVFARHGPLVVLGFLERYLARQIELGRLRPHDPRGAARALMGMLVVFAIGREILPPIRAGFPSADDYARQVIDIFLGGLRTPESA